MTRVENGDGGDKHEQQEKLAAFFEELAVDKVTTPERRSEPVAMRQSIIEQIRSQASRELQQVMQELEKNHSGVASSVATAVGAGTGAATSLAALSTLGTVSGLSAGGVTAGLVAAGELLGGGMLVGAGVLATPIAALGALGYGLARNRQKKSRVAAIGIAIQKISDIRSPLLQHKEHFGEELARIKTVLESLASLKMA